MEAKIEGNLSDEGRTRLTDIADMNQQYEKWKDLSRTAGAVGSGRAESAHCSISLRN